jgi:hypothetical protein
MTRVEIIFSQSLEEDVLEALAPIAEAHNYTMIPGVHGRGHSRPKMGDAVWPEENKILIVYCSCEASTALVMAMDDLRGRYPNEGIACFVIHSAGAAN